MRLEDQYCGSRKIMFLERTTGKDLRLSTIENANEVTSDESYHRKMYYIVIIVK